MIVMIRGGSHRRRPSSARQRGLAGIAALAVAACTAPGLSTTESAIRGGAVDDGDPAVAALSILGLYAYCTATLISHHTVLTAGHCNLDAMEADFGTQSDAPAQSIDVTTVAVHPLYAGEGKPYDLALMKLASDPVGIAPLLLNDAPLAAGDVGRTIRHIGFGVTDDATGEGGGTRRTVSYPLHRIDAMLIYSGADGKQSCNGDSGGPALMTQAGQTTETLVGVVSDGPDCQLSQDGWDDRVDLVKDWVVQTVTAWDAPPGFGAAGDASGSSGGSGGSSGGSGGSSGGFGAPGGGQGDGAGGTAMSGCEVAPGAGGLSLWLLGALAWLRGRRPRPATAGARSPSVRAT